VAAYSTATNTGNDHLQVTLVKNPERSEFREVRNLIQTTAERVGRERSESIDTAADLTTGARVDSTRFGSGRNTNPYDSELTLSNLHLQNTPGELNDFNRSMLRRTIYFDHDQSELDANDKARIDQFIVDFREADNETQNSTVRLEGHASRAGSTAYNRRLVNARLASVMGYLREKGFPNIEARVATENRSDEMAEEYPDTGSNAAEFRSVRIIVGSGELQNTVAHEFGHVFGLLDEYATVGTSFSGTGTAPGTEVGHSDMSENIGAGRVLSENSDNIMSAGNTVRAQHYGPFGWALHQLTNKNWEVF
ncbi:MAG TPA: OmpA family protein, partial [Draconibacterium sp.]|nr:OmpA family protein [Draconibacterium sp.]